jgi:MFS family permease
MRSTFYRYYVLGLLMLIYAFNFLDRQVITIVAPALKVDLGISDAQLGLLFGTAFALFFSVFGIPIAKLADGWSRVRTISAGLAFWSSMTTLSGFAGNFMQLGAARIGVGVGEASANPAAYSLLQDYFPKHQRATALSLYSSGIYFGVGASLIFGGAIIKYWETHYSAGTAPFGLSGWQATFIAFGMPGLLLAVLMLLTVREPVRGAIDGLPSAGDPAPFRSVMHEFASMIPPWNLFAFARAPDGQKAVIRSLLTASVLIVATTLTIYVTDSLLAPEKRSVITTIGAFAVTTNTVQWTAIAIGLYCVSSWQQSVKLRDAPFYAMISNKAVIYTIVAGSLLAFISFGLSPFLYLYAKQRFTVGAEEGLTLGWIAALCGVLGATSGGVIADWSKRRHPAGRLLMVISSTLVSAVAIIYCFMANTLTQFYIGLGIHLFTHIFWLGPCAATVQDLVLPRMRGMAGATMLLGTGIIGLGLGPYLVGLMSDVTGDLRLAMISTVAMIPPIVICLFIAARSLPALEASVTERARNAGEPI